MLFTRKEPMSQFLRKRRNIHFLYMRLLPIDMSSSVDTPRGIFSLRNRGDEEEEENVKEITTKINNKPCQVGTKLA